MLVAEMENLEDHGSHTVPSSVACGLRRPNNQVLLDMVVFSSQVDVFAFSVPTSLPG